MNLLTLLVVAVAARRSGLLTLVTIEMVWSKRFIT